MGSGSVLLIFFLFHRECAEGFGEQLLSPAERDERLAFYANHNIGWVARPKHDSAPDGFKRAGRFKKASNMNYGEYSSFI